MYQVCQKGKKREGKFKEKNIFKQIQIQKSSNIDIKRTQMQLKQDDTGALALLSHN